MKVKTLPAGPLGTNCYIVHHGEHALIVDPGGDAEKVIHYLTEEELDAKAILLTHAHFDHIGAVDELRSYDNLDVYLHENEAAWLEDPKLNGSLLFLGNEIEVKRAEYQLSAGKMQISSFSFEIIHTPGHSPGSVSFIFHEHEFVISGDVLFNQGIGRTDLPGGDIKQLEQSICDSLYKLPDTYTVYPGHGSKTTIRNEKQSNPFFPRK
ncbi:Glyoxylase, beta-lactamase superfamily II [Lentibacillus halodurans]|uniref:Glyoxylase, beta-lactamase superfamily II n=1 Tax=Lentibacillus halodurans TaxID=237679 RepID=A0A1I0V4Z2_9BACI|nr:MBL fold metallo-hydrolase [Lentibacillus halodurans]SFA71117.1 Glyoxylase, beta-lactamase superfamily II [Lentibacillus halodurans]